jgi:tRNA G10  N-methylase Trm11
MRFVLHFNANVAAHICFAEFSALLEREGLAPGDVWDAAGAAAAFPFVDAAFADEATAARVLHSAVLVRHYYTPWSADGAPAWQPTLHDAVAALADAPPALTAAATAADRSWRVFVTAERGRLPPAVTQAHVRAHVEDALAFDGRVDLSDAADTTLTVLLDYGGGPSGAAAAAVLAPTTPHCAACGPLCDAAHAGYRPYRALIGARHETSRRLVGELALTRRAYVGPTSMDPEIGLVMANLAHVGPGRAVLDPFVGTGSLALACAELGASAWGTDIDYRVVVLGKAGRDVRANFDQRGLPHPELLRADNAAPVLCAGGPGAGATDAALPPPPYPLSALGAGGRPFFDAIVTDPPYGVRAGARKTGQRPERAAARVGGGGAAGDGAPAAAASPLANPHFPPTQPYDGEEVVIDLLDAAARLLVPGGRLVYLYPCVPHEYSRAQLPAHPCLTVVDDPEEALSRMLARRLVVMVKTAPYDVRRAAEYRAASVAAAVAAGTLGAGHSLKARLARAYDEWFDSHKPLEGALEAAREKRRQQHKKQREQGAAGEASPELAPGAGGAAAQPQAPAPVTGTDDSSAPVSPVATPASAAAAAEQLSRNRLRGDLRSLHKQQLRRDRLAAAADGAPVVSRRARMAAAAAAGAMRRGQEANLRHVADMKDALAGGGGGSNDAAGGGPLSAEVRPGVHVGQLPFSRVAPPPSSGGGVSGGGSAPRRALRQREPPPTVTAAGAPSAAFAVALPPRHAGGAAGGGAAAAVTSAAAAGAT